MFVFSICQFACYPSHGVLLLWNMTPCMSLCNCYYGIWHHACHCVTVFKRMLWSQKIRKSLPSVGITSQKNRILSDAATKTCNHGDCPLFVEFVCLLSHFEIPVLTLDCVVHVFFFWLMVDHYTEHMYNLCFPYDQHSIEMVIHQNSMANFTQLNTFLWNAYQLLSKQTFTMLVRWS
jgi:hypothetical protein